jgi:hypothetical protein
MATRAERDPYSDDLLPGLKFHVFRRSLGDSGYIDPTVENRDGYIIRPYNAITRLQDIGSEKWVIRRDLGELGCANTLGMGACVPTNPEYTANPAQGEPNWRNTHFITGMFICFVN